MIFCCNNITKSYGETKILKDITFNINEKEKVALVGINGAGKSTLFKIIAGELSADSGDVNISKNAKLGYFSQNLKLDNTKTVFQELLSVFLHIIKKENELKNIEEKMNLNSLTEDEIKNLAEKYNKISEYLANNNGLDYKSQIKKVLKGLGFLEEDFEKKISSFSGGQKTRIALAKILLISPDVLLLDEPTNHLDIESISWLEKFLKNYAGTILIISHDRYFLNKIVSKVIEIENSKCSIYKGNYDEYYEKKQISRDIYLKHYLNQQKEIKKQEESIKRLKAFNREKFVKRARSKEKALDKIDVLEKPKTIKDKMKLTLSPKKESGNDVLDVCDVSKSFSKTLFKNISFNIKKGEKVALIGENGIGKTTLLKMILGKEQLDCGSITLGSNVVIGYYDQEQSSLDLDKTIFDEIADAHPNLKNVDIRNTLALFMFTGDDIFKKINTLSGGEKGRISLAKIMLSNANLLILDEPTNHLDISSKEILENALNSYTGTCLYISHDRYFINNTASKLIKLTKDKLYTYLGNYDYYAEKSCEEIFSEDKAENQPEIGLKNDWKIQKEQQAKIRKKQNDLKKIEKEIEDLEEEIKQADYELSLEKVYTNLQKTREIFEQKNSYQEKLNSLYKDWEDLMQ